MSEQKEHNLVEIEGLLASRQQLMGWLERVETAGVRTPEQVRAKVRADYRARLAQVVSQLATHGELIGSTLEALRAQAKEFRQLRSEEREVRAEAELRHSVGEYTDDEWQLVELESSGKISEFDQELERLSGETGRLEEVQALISVNPAPAAEPERSFASAPQTELPTAPEPHPPLTLVREPEPEPQAPPMPQPRPEAPRFVPRGTGVGHSGATGPLPKSRESGPARTIPLTPGHAPSAAVGPQDELAFLRSVTLDQAPEERHSQPMAKTLKCAECGSLNRPTEWYCERCGAELAAL
jgi:hypothetical protein